MWSDLFLLQSHFFPRYTGVHTIRSLEELLERDRQREKDGFPRKIRIGRLIKPGKGRGSKIVIVPTTVEEKFVHDLTHHGEGGDGGATGGSGEGHEGEVVGEEPIYGPGQEGSGGAGQGQGAQHEIESAAYDLGKILTENFELPNLQNKGKRASLTRYTYDLTDRHKGAGQILDKKATLRRIVETNIQLGNLDPEDELDTSRLVVSPDDKVYRILSKEREFESQAVVFFVRDYSGSMSGLPTEIVVSQHVLIYAWLLYQYEKQVETRFILHDTEAKEVPDFHVYYNSTVAGGTKVESAYQLVNKIIEEEGLARDYNIYVFHGTDGEDWDTEGKRTMPELEKMVNYSNRVGITIARANASGGSISVMERYIKDSGLLDKQREKLRMDSVTGEPDDDRLLKGIKRLIS